jgi:hypothetical protein
MDTVNFLEQLANNTSFSEEAHKLISEQPNEIRIAYLENNAEFIKNKFPHVGYLASTTQVIEM